MPANNTLGRGLSSLIPPKTNAAAGLVKPSVLSPDDKDKILQIEVEKIKVNPFQPRKNFQDSELAELIESIKEYGIIQPLIVSNNNGEYELIAGERRLRAAKKMGLAKVPAILREAGEQEKLEVALVENLQRENLNPIETGLAYKRLADEFNLTQEEIAKKVSKSRPGVANTMRLLNLPEEIQIALIDGRLTEGHAKYLVGIEGAEKQMVLFRKIMHNNLSVKDTDNEAKRMGGTKAARIKINYADKDKEFALRQFFGTKVEIKRKGKGGQIVIEFFSEEELGGIIAKVKK
jgi:ParB family transcriptional regulator, chromosome partitioning protein